jgi:hypothetical protein
MMTPWARRSVEKELSRDRHALQWLSMVQKHMTLCDAIQHLQDQCATAALEIAEDDALAAVCTAENDAAIKAINSVIRSTNNPRPPIGLAIQDHPRNTPGHGTNQGTASPEKTR